MKEQIEEKNIRGIARVLCDAHEPCSKCVWRKCDVWNRAVRLYNAGYRKQKEGEWIEKSEDKDEYYEYCYKCSVCGKWSIMEEEEFSNFCPNCGAHMRGGKNEN
jgi:hypothetical protein